MARSARSLLVVAAAIACCTPAAGKSPQEAADELVERARSQIAGQRFDDAERDLDNAIRKVPNHTAAHFELCALSMAKAEWEAKNFVPRDDALDAYVQAAKTCARASGLVLDPSSQRVVAENRVRALLASASWVEAVPLLAGEVAASPDDPRLAGRYAAVLNRAGRIDASRSELARAALRGEEFNRAARFEYVWERFERDDSRRLERMIAGLLEEEADARRRAVLEVLSDASAGRDEAAVLGFLRLVETGALLRADLDRLWLRVAGPPPDDDSALAMGTLKIDRSGLEEPVLADRVPPRIPPIALAARGKTRVVLLARVNADGSVHPVWIVRTNNPDLVGPASEAVLAWRYVPAKRNGEAIPFPVSVRVDFKRH